MDKLFDVMDNLANFHPDLQAVEGCSLALEPFHMGRRVTYLTCGAANRRAASSCSPQFPAGDCILQVAQTGESIHS